jgi:hypothetical protein
MAKNRNRGIQRQGQQQPAQRQGDGDEEAITPEVVLPQANVPLINAQIVQILIQNNTPEQVERLMEADLSYNERRLKIVRDHILEHPDAIDARSSRKTHRMQYLVLMVIAAGLLIAMPSMPLAVAGVFGIIAVLIISGVLVNARERELDLQGFINMINIIMKGQQK